VKKTVRWGTGALTFAGMLGATLLPATAASAAVLPPPPGFVCPAGSDTVNAPSTLTGVNQPALAGTVCVYSGTTAFRLVHTNGGWRAEVKSVFGSRTTDVRFYEPVLNGRVEVVTQNGQVVVRT
jgi:hypothetical protein